MALRSSPTPAEAAGTLVSGDVRRHNLGIVARYLLGNGPSSRSQIADGTGLTRGSVTALASALLDAAIIHEASPENARGKGRPLTLLNLAADHVAILALQLDADQVTGFLTTITGEPLLRIAEQHGRPMGRPEPDLDVMASVLGRTLDACHDLGRHVVDMTVVVFAPVAGDPPVVLTDTDLGWGVVDVLGGLRRREPRMPSGAVRGTWRDGSAAFLGIPFAEPPVGDLRFAAPVPHRPWEGVRPAVEYGATPQRKPLSEVTLIPEPSIPGESTLNVNVFTPSPVAADGAGLPVLVWIHGGGYVAGSPASTWYDGAAFNRDGVVTVTVSYRLGFDGFGWIEDAPRNRGVLDWLLALEWVKYNIAAFGGDPSRVTISGQSAGGGAVLTLLGCPRAQPLFNRAVSLSGPPTSTTMSDAEALGRNLAGLGGVAPTVAGLSTLTEAGILALQGQVSSIGGDGEVDPIDGLAAMLGGGLTLGPVIDGDLIPLPTAEALAAGIGSDKELVLGTTDNEFAMVLAGAGESLSGVPAAGILGAVGAATEVIEAYVADHPGLGAAALVGQYVTDHMFRAPALNLAELRAGSLAPTWLYRFAWNSPTIGNACHCLDVPFMFDCLGAEHIAQLAGAEPPQSLADEVHGSAVSFIATGDPGWQAWDDTARAVRVYDVPTTIVTDGYADARALLPERASR